MFCLTIRSRCVVLAVATAALLVASAPGTAVAAPSNDNFARAKAIKLGADLRGTVNGATRQGGEPRHAESLATRSVWYTFTSRRKVALGLGTCNTDFDTVLAVYTGRSLRSLRAVERNNDGCGRSGGGSRVTFTARPGKVYRIAVAGFAPSGRFRLTAVKVNVPPNDDFVDAATIRVGETVAASAQNATRELGEPAHRNGYPHTIWFKLSVALPTNVEISDGSCGVTVYTGGRVDALTAVPPLSGSCQPRFVAQPGTTYRIVVERFSGGSVRLSAGVFVL